MVGKNGRDWLAIRKQYETSDISQRKLAKNLGISVSTLMKRAMRENWTQNKALVASNIRAIDSKLQKAVQAKMEKELGPWIEQQKVRFTKRGFKLASRGLKRVDQYFEANPDDVDAKEESMIAKAGETYHRIGRVALGMNDGSAVATPLTLNLLGNHQAIQINAPNDTSSNT